MHGKGKFYYANGNFYEGQFAFDVKHGWGELVYAKGGRYKGSWYVQQTTPTEAYWITTRH